MGNGDNRKSLKMRRRSAQNALKARIKRRAVATKAARKRK